MLRNEEKYIYKACDEGSENVSMLQNVRIKLIGNNAPTVQISNKRDLEVFCMDLNSDSAVEELYLICVNNQCQIVSTSLISTGDISECSAYTSKIAKIALLSNASGIFLTHNHPSGTMRPSMEDIQSTALIQKALNLFDIKVFDHMITTQFGGYSMRQNGDIH